MFRPQKKRKRRSLVDRIQEYVDMGLSKDEAVTIVSDESPKAMKRHKCLEAAEKRKREKERRRLRKEQDEAYEKACKEDLLKMKSNTIVT